MADMDHPVSPDVLDKCDRYAEELRRWQKKINLVGNSTLDKIYTRHILDAAQLIQSVPRGTVLDVGSGAGVPGLIWAIFSDQPIYLCERIGKKTAFLSYMVRELALGDHCKVINEDVTNVIGPFDIITARAVTYICEFLDLIQQILHKKSLVVLPKGAGYQNELNEALKKWHFDVDIQSSRTNTDAKVLYLTSVFKR